MRSKRDEKPMAPSALPRAGKRSARRDGYLRTGVVALLATLPNRCTTLRSATLISCNSSATSAKVAARSTRAAAPPRRWDLRGDDSK